MASIDERALLPSVTPSASVPDPALHLDVRPTQFGGYVAQGQQQFGQEVFQAGKHWGQIAADDMANQFEEKANRILYGDPNAPVVKPDGSTARDTGFMGLKGGEALQQRQSYDTRLKKLFDDSRGTLLSMDQRQEFDRTVRRMHNIMRSEMGRHADAQANVYGLEVNKDTIRLNAKKIASDPNNNDAFLHATSDMVDAATKAAQIRGAQPGDAIWNKAIEDAKSAATETRIVAIGAKDPVRALRMAEENQGILGEHYARLVDHYRPHAEQQEGQAIGRRVATGAPPPVGDDAKAVVRHYEPFHSSTIRDNDGKYRVGYSSDTVTKADGSVAPVTSETVVTRADAERDLDRRLGVSQGVLRKQIGEETWNGLSAQSKASLSSVIYNYGDNGVPRAVIDAAKTGDGQKIASAIRALASDNKGINASRRAGEAANVAAGNVDRSYPDQVQEIINMNLPPHKQSAALHELTQINTARKTAESARNFAFDQAVKDGVAESKATGQPSNPKTEADFVRHYGQESGPARYEEYQDAVTFYASWHAVKDMPDEAQNQFLANSEPKPGPGFAALQRRHVHLKNEIAKLQDHRASDPAGSVADTPIVRGAYAGYKSADPATFRPVVDARLLAQGQVGIPPELRSAATEAEAKHYAAALKTVSSGQADPDTQKKVIETVTADINARYGDRAKEVLTRVVSHLAIKPDAALILADAMSRLSQGEETPRATPDNARRAQIERDALRSQQLAAQRRQVSEQYGFDSRAVTAGPSPGPASAPPPPSDTGRSPALDDWNAATADRDRREGAVTSQAVQGAAAAAAPSNQKKSFSDAVDLLRSDPARLMPLFVKRYGIDKVPPDMQKFLVPEQGR